LGARTGHYLLTTMKVCLILHLDWLSIVEQQSEVDKNINLSCVLSSLCVLPSLCANIFVAGKQRLSATESSECLHHNDRES